MNKEILTKAIEKAIAGGWTVNDWVDCEDFEWTVELDSEFETENLCMMYSGMGEQFYASDVQIIFNHDFAKALWGDGWTTEFPDTNLKADWCNDDGSAHFEGHTYLFHLQQMVIAEDPIKYLGENIDDKPKEV